MTTLFRRHLLLSSVYNNPQLALGLFIERPTLLHVQGCELSLTLRIAVHVGANAINHFALGVG
jgi:hypothetical protein